jgi:hypothetical protein
MLYRQVYWFDSSSGHYTTFAGSHREKIDPKGARSPEAHSEGWAVAKLVKAPVFETGDRWFEPIQPRVIGNVSPNRTSNHPNKHRGTCTSRGRPFRVLIAPRRGALRARRRSAKPAKDTTSPFETSLMVEIFDSLWPVSYATNPTLRLVSLDG